MKRIFTLVVILIWSNMSFAQTEALEMSSGFGPSGTGPVVGPLTVTMSNNTNNPTGNTFVAVTPVTEVSFTVINSQYALPAAESATETSVMFGATLNNPTFGSNPAVVPAFNYEWMNAVSSPPNSSFTSYNSSAGTGITALPGGNAAINVYTSTNGLHYNNGNGTTGAVSTNGRAEMATLKIDFNRPVNNPILHLVGLGGFYSVTNVALTFSSELELQTPGLTLTRLSGSSEFVLDGTSTKILNNATTMGPTTGAGAASGSVQVNGLGITSLEFKVFIRGDGGRTEWTRLNTNGTRRWNAGDQWLISASLDLAGSISGNVGLDTDNDDIKNSNISTVTVTLYNDVDGNGVYTPGTDTQVTSTTTDGNGNYEFTNVAQGDYVVVETDPANHSSVIDSQSSDGDTYPNTNTNDNSIPVSLDPGEVDANNDFVDELSGNISGTVFIDTDNNDTGDAPQTTTTTVSLYNDVNGNGLFDSGTDTFVSSTTTDGSGDYSFTNIPPGSYVVVETDPATYSSVLDGDNSTDNGTDGNPDLANPNTNDNAIPVSLAPGETDADNDFVDELTPGNISGTVFIDTDNNDTGDAPQTTATTVSLYNDVNGNGVFDSGTDTFVSSTTTNGSGDYSFTNIPPGSYVVVETDPATYTSVLDGDTSGDNGADGNPDFTNPNTNDNAIPVSLAPGETDADNDFVDEQLASITGNVSIDTNNDDNGDSNPPSAVTLTLYNDVNGDGVLDGSDTQVGTTTTDGSGNYAFNNLPPGDYIVVESDPTGYYPVKDETTIDGADRPNTNTNNNELPVSVVGGETDAGNNFVDEQGVSTISGTVWEDNTDNSQLDKDSGVSGVVISLLDGGGNVIATQTTGSGGTYSFTNVPEGNYTLQIGSTPKPLQYDNDDNSDGPNDTEENNTGGATTSGNNTSDGSIPVSIVGGGIVEVDGSNDFIISNFTNGNAPLPVNLIKFEAKALQDMIRLEWTTASEIGNRGFEIMHSIDAKTFASLGFIQGHHSSNERLSYSFDHDSPLYGKNYYQLYQYDFNKPTPSKSNIISAMYDNESGIMLIYPNPSSSELRIKGVKIGDIIKVYASNGLLVQDKQVSVDNLIELNVERFNGGFYNFVVIRNGLKVMSTKFVKK